MIEYELVKENPGLARRGAAGTRALVAGTLGSLLALVLVLMLERRLPEPLTRAAPPQRFIAEIAHEHLVNLTALGPRVAGSYENDVAAVRVLLEALHEIKRNANHHHRLEIDVHHADGAFPILFLDGMTNVYRGVGMVAARLSPAGGSRGGRGRAVLLNCHYDTVPDSPGASDDGAGCAVLLEAARALAAGAAPLRHDVVFLFNGAEENIMQASHAFVTTHKWARDVRAFINIEACGAGGREVLFQAGPHDPWILEVYAAAAPYPFASSLAQELFESGLVPADTDFRVFRDFGNLSGVDLAWSANGYVYHTRLDVARAVPAASLQRAGDNVLALLRGLLSSPSLEAIQELAPRPVYFDILGVASVAIRGSPALALALLLLAAAAYRVNIPPKGLFISGPAWRRQLLRTLLALAAGGAAGAAAACAGGLCAGSLWYSRPWLLAPLAAVPAVSVSWLVVWKLAGGESGGAGSAARGAGVKALLLLHALQLLCAVLAGLRGGFLPALWVAALLLVDAAAPPPLAALAPPLAALAPPLAALAWLLPWAVGAQLWYVSMDSLQMLLPVMGRAGASTPSHILVPGLAGALALAASCWLWPLLLAARRPMRLVYPVLVVSALCLAACLLAPPAASYSAARPQRHMLFYTRRTTHGGEAAGGGGEDVQYLYWMPDLDRHAPHAARDYVPELQTVVPMDPASCLHLPYCGAPYYLPVLSFISLAHWAPAPPPPRAAHIPPLRHNATATVLGQTCDVHLQLEGPAHVVVVVSARRGGRLAATSLLAAPPPRARAPPPPGNNTYMITLHAGYGASRNWDFHLQLEYPSPPKVGECASLSLAGHSMAGEEEDAEGVGRGGDDGREGGSPLRRLLASFPEWTAPTGWPVDLHLLTV